MLDKKAPGKPAETTATTEELLTHYNRQVPDYNALVREKFAGDEEKIAALVQDEIPFVELVVSRENLIERIRRQNLRLGRTIVSRSQDLLKEKVADPSTGERVLKDGRWTTGLTYQAILKKLTVEFPEASTSVACLRWYNVHMKGDAADEGLAFPDLPQYRPRSSAKRKAA